MKDFPQTCFGSGKTIITILALIIATLEQRIFQGGFQMETNLIFEGKATLEDLYVLNGLGFEFVIAGGVITNVFHR